MSQQGFFKMLAIVNLQKTLAQKKLKQILRD